MRYEPFSIIVIDPTDRTLLVLFRIISIEKYTPIFSVLTKRDMYSSGIMHTYRPRKRIPINYRQRETINVTGNRYGDRAAVICLLVPAFRLSRGKLSLKLH